MQAEAGSLKIIKIILFDFYTFVAAKAGKASPATKEAKKTAAAAVANTVNQRTGFVFFTAGVGSSTTYNVLNAAEEETAYWSLIDIIFFNSSAVFSETPV